MADPWETEGDEWARGTPYEDEESTRMRRALQRLDDAVLAMGSAVLAMQRGCKLVRDLYAVERFASLGLTRDEAWAEVLAARAGALSPTGEVRLLKARFRELAHG